MSFLRIDPHSATVRFFKEKTEQLPLHEMENTPGKQWYKTVTLIFLDNGLVRVTAALNTLTLQEIKLLKKNLKNLGYTKISYNHNSIEHLHLL
jgi:hypothetical protein